MCSCVAAYTYYTEALLFKSSYLVSSSLLLSCLCGYESDPLHGALAEDAVRHRCIHGLGTALDKCSRRVGQGTSRDREVIDNQSGLTLHLPDDLQDLGALVM